MKTLWGPLLSTIINSTLNPGTCDLFSEIPISSHFSQKKFLVHLKEKHQWTVKVWWTLLQLRQQAAGRAKQLIRTATIRKINYRRSFN